MSSSPMRATVSSKKENEMRGYSGVLAFLDKHLKAPVAVPK